MKISPIIFIYIIRRNAGLWMEFFKKTIHEDFYYIYTDTAEKKPLKEADFLFHFS